MFGKYSKADIEKLLAAGGSSLESVLSSARQGAQISGDGASGRIEKNRKIIEGAQQAIVADTVVLNQAQEISRIVSSLGG